MVEEITPAELRDALDSEDPPQVIDVRSSSAFERGHIPGSENIPFTHLLDSVEEYDWSDEIVVVCPHGESSLQAARLLESYEGVDSDAMIANLETGLQDWEYEVETGK